METQFIEIIKAVGDDPEREGLKKTPARAAKAFRQLTQGYEQTPEALVGDAVYAATHTDMVIVQDIEIYSLCEHHLLPFIGKCHIAYIPDEKVIGLSKLARIADCFARRFQIQESLTREIATAIDDLINPLGVSVIVEAEHMCMRMRGVAKQNSKMTTSCMLGVFRDNAKTRTEFLTLLQLNKK